MKMLATWLLIIGGLVWGVYALTGSSILDSLGSLARIIYALVGLAALYGIVDALGMMKSK